MRFDKGFQLLLPDKPSKILEPFRYSDSCPLRFALKYVHEPKLFKLSTNFRTLQAMHVSRNRYFCTRVCVRLGRDPLCRKRVYILFEWA